MSKFEIYESMAIVMDKEFRVILDENSMGYRIDINAPELLPLDLGIPTKDGKRRYFSWQTIQTVMLEWAPK